MAVEPRPKVSLTEEPNIVIGDINDITGTIADKERHVTTGKVDVTLVGDSVGIAKEATLSSIDNKISSIQPRYIASGTVTVENGSISVSNFPSVYPLPATQVSDLKIVSVQSGSVSVTTVSSILDKGTTTPYRVSVVSGSVNTTIVGDNVGLAKEATLSSIDGKITVCDTNNVIISTGFTGVRLTSTDIMLPVDVQAKYYESSQEINTLVNPSSIVTGVSHIAIANFETKTIIGKCNFDGVLHIDCSPSGTNNYFQDVYTVPVSSGKVFTATFTERFDYCIVRIENTSTATGQAVVWVNRGV